MFGVEPRVARLSMPIGAPDGPHYSVAWVMLGHEVSRVAHRGGRRFSLYIGSHPCSPGIERDVLIRLPEREHLVALMVARYQAQVSLHTGYSNPFLRIAVEPTAALGMPTPLFEFGYIDALTFVVAVGHQHFVLTHANEARPGTAEQAAGHVTAVPVMHRRCNTRFVDVVGFGHLGIEHDRVFEIFIGNDNGLCFSAKHLKGGGNGIEKSSGIVEPGVIHFHTTIWMYSDGAFWHNAFQLIDYVFCIFDERDT